MLAILEQAVERRRQESPSPLRVVDDQRGSPTAAADLAEALVALCRRLVGEGSDVRGLLHLCNAGVTSWFGFARAILDQSGYADVAIDPVATGVFETAAPRPAYSVLDCSRALSLGIQLRPWTEALAGYLAGPDRPTHLLAASSASIPDPAPVRRKVSH